MHLRRLVSALLAMWLAGSLFMAGVATANFRIADEVFRTQVFELIRTSELLGSPLMRQVLRYEASEMNRFYFESWEAIQMGLGAALLLPIIFGKLRRYLAVTVVVMLALVAAQHWVLTPRLTSLGRLFDFADPGSLLTERSQFRTLHNLYTGIELAKMGTLAALSGILLYQGERRRRSRHADDEVDAVHDADHGHVDR